LPGDHSGSRIAYANKELSFLGLQLTGRHFMGVQDSRIRSAMGVQDSPVNLSFFAGDLPGIVVDSALQGRGGWL
jgi:hypothetical protein